MFDQVIVTTTAYTQIELPPQGYHANNDSSVQLNALKGRQTPAMLYFCCAFDAMPDTRQVVFAQ